MLFLTYKSHGENHSEGVALNRRTLDLYSHEIFGIIESKMDEMIIILEDIGLIKTLAESDRQPTLLVITNLDLLRSY